MPDEKVREMGPFLFWYDLDEIELNLDRIVVPRQTDSLTHPMDMGIDNNARYSICISQDDISCLPSHTRKGD